MKANFGATLAGIKKVGSVSMKDIPTFTRVAKSYHDADTAARRKGIEESQKEKMKEFGQKDNA